MKSPSHPKSCFLGAALFAMSAASASATLLVYEGFDYTAGTSLGATTNGGSGWSGAWTVNSGTAPTAGANLSYNSLTTSGGSVTQSTSGGTVTRNFAASTDVLDANNNGVFGDAVTSSISQTLWLSFVAKRETGTGADDYLALMRDNGSEALRIGRFTGSTNWQVGGVFSGTQTASSVAWDTGTGNTFALVRVDLKRTGTGTATNLYDAYLWLYTGSTEVPAGEPTLGSASASFIHSTASAAGSGTGVNALRLVNTSTRNASFDEIRIGTSFADVAVSSVPEPSAFAALAGVGCLGFAALRRRRR